MTTSFKIASDLPWVLLSAVFAALVFVGCGSSAPAVVMDPEIRVLDTTSVDTAPEIVGGFERVRELTRYPQAAQQQGASGTIWIRCVVSSRGRATRLTIAEGGHYALESEAIRVVEQLRFTPGKIQNAPVSTTIEIPITIPAQARE